MGRKVPGPWFVVAVIVIAGGAMLLVSSVWLSPHRADLATFGSFAAAIVGLAASLIIYVSKIRPPGEPTESQALDTVADLLAGAVKDQWTRAAADRRLLQPKPIPVRWQRPSQPYTGPISAAVGSERFRPLPGLPAAEEGRLQHGQLRELHAVYGGLGSGRLVIVGAPGSGKSGAAVLLVLAALEHREKVLEDWKKESDKGRPLVPVPIMFTLHGWDPNAQPVQDWLATRLQQTYPQFAGKRGAAEAAGLIVANKVAVILDGLDEIPNELRPVALQALSEQATFRLVVLARSAEMAAAAKQHLLEGAAVLELQDVDPATAADYLTRIQLDPPPPGWGELTALLRGMPESPIAKALSSPLTLTLVRDTYRANDDVREFLDVCNTAGRSGKEIEDYLLDRVLLIAYAPRPGQKPLRYEPQAAQHALRYIAARMNQDRTRDLEWWNIRQWTRRWPRATATVLLLGLAGGLAGGLVAGLIIGLAAGSAAGLWAGLTLGEDDPPERIWRLRWRRIFSGQSLLAGLSAGLLGGLMAQVVTAHSPAAFLANLLTGGLAPVAANLRRGWQHERVVGLAVLSGLAGALWAGLAAGSARPAVGHASPLNPQVSWRRDRAAGLVRGLVVGLAIAVGLAILAGLKADLRLGLAVIAGLGVGLLSGLENSATWPASLAFVQLAGRRRTPVRLMRFLNDAQERGVLRAIGPVYQFRHARLHDRIADVAEAFEEVLADDLRVLGPDHPSTLTARNLLAHSRARAGDLAGAAQVFEEVLADDLRVLGPDHPSTLATRNELAYWRWQAGNVAGATEALRELLTDRLRVQGPDHPDTLATRANLASLRGEAEDS